MVKFFKFVTLAVALVVVAGLVRSFFVETVPPTSTDRLSNEEDVAEVATNNPFVGPIEYQIVLFDRDPTTGMRVFTVNDSPVQGKLKAYLEDQVAREGGDLIFFKNHPDGESNTWVEIPKPLFLSLTED